MNKLSTRLAAIFCLLLSASAAFAQQQQSPSLQPNAPLNFAGSWELDTAKSKLPERARVESLTLNVAQNDREITVETKAKRAAARPEAMAPGNDSGGGGGGMPADGNRGRWQQNGGGGTGRAGGAMSNGNGKLTYSLDGRETAVEAAASTDGIPPPSVKLFAKMETDGKLKLVATRSTDSQMGSVSIKTTEIWELIDGGKSLKVVREIESPRGLQTTEMYFTRKPSSEAQEFKSSVIVPGEEFKSPVAITDKEMMMTPGTLSAKDIKGVYGGEIKNPNDKSLSGASPMPKILTHGVINKSALSLPKPSYPAEARGAKASGAVNVQITIDEQGRVVSAKAVSGHQALRAAAEDAARKATFAPTMLEGIPVKVTGVIVYNFVP